MPAYNEAAHVGDVVRGMPSFVDLIIVVDDASIDDTSSVAQAVGDPRVLLVRHETNQGLGGSLIDAHRVALESDADIMVVMAGDGQMDPGYLPSLFDPLIDEGYDFTKGNRFFSARSMAGMPRHRVLGNVILTFLTKLATGYWDVFDPQNGYTAITREASEDIDWSSVARDYSFENDVLARLGLARRRVRDVDIPALYGQEVSDVRVHAVIPDLLRTLRRAFWRRIWLQYVVRSFSPVALFLFFGGAMTLWSVVFGIWVAWSSAGPPQASTATVMLVVLPLLMGFELLLAALVLDIMNAPK